MARPVVPVGSHDSCNLVLIALAGSGKRRTANMILGREVSRVSFGGDSGIKEISTGTASYKGRMLTVTDAPSFHDTDWNEENVQQRLYAGFEKAFTANKEGVNAFLYVKPYGTRFMSEDRQLFSCIKTVFGADSLKKFGILLLSHGDYFEKDQEELGINQPICDWCLGNRMMRPVLQEFNNRVVIFNNVRKGERARENQVDQLLGLADQSGGHRYTMEDFMISSADAQRILETHERAIKKDAKVEIRFLLDQVGKIGGANNEREGLNKFNDILGKAQKLVDNLLQSTGVWTTHF